MRRAAGWALAAGTVAGAGALLCWAIGEGLEEREREEALEHPVERKRLLLRDSAGNPVVTLDRAAQERLGLVVRALDRAESLPQVRAYGRVLDPAPLVEDCGAIASLDTALAASRAEYDRLRTLHEAEQNASRRALEAAEAHFKADEARLRTAERLLSGRWGAAVAGLSPGERESFLDRLVTRKAALLLVHLPVGEPVAGLPSGCTIVPAGERGVRLRAAAVFAAPAVDEKLQGPAFLLQVDSSSVSVNPGAAVVAHLEFPGTAREGVMVPASAVIRYLGTSWVYLREGEDRFLRRSIALEAHSGDGWPSGDGWFVSTGVEPGTSVVVTGAQALLSEETRNGIQLEEE